MPRQNLLELLHRPVVVEVVKVVEGGQVQRIVGTVGQRLRSGSRLRGRNRRSRQQKSTTGTEPRGVGTGKDNWLSIRALFTAGSLNFSLPEARIAREPRKSSTSRNIRAL